VPDQPRRNPTMDNRDSRGRVQVVATDQGLSGDLMSFGPQSQQIEYGSHSLVIDAENRKIRLFSSMETPVAESSHDWEGVQGKLSELGVKILSEVAEEQVDGILVAEGAF
jgi:hypothetical protein